MFPVFVKKISENASPNDLKHGTEVPRGNAVFSPGFSESVAANLHNNTCYCYGNEFLLFTKNYRAVATAL